MMQNNRRCWILCAGKPWSSVVPPCNGKVTRSFPTNYLLNYRPINNKTALVDMMAWRRSGDRPSSGSIMTISLVTHTVVGLGTISWQCDRPRYDVAYVELITALNIVGYLWNPQELMAISTRLYLQHTRWICRNFFQAMDWNEWLC